MPVFQNFTGLAVPLDRANVDTDQMVPSRFLMKPRDYDYGSLLFCDLLRGPRRDPEFPLNLERYSNPQVIVAGHNFGCGSAREQAAYALCDYGFRAVFGPSFGDIFRRNCLRNGLLVGVISAQDSASLRHTLRETPGAQLAINLQQQTITDPAGRVYRFQIDINDKYRLREEKDDIARTLEQETVIAAFERTLAAAVPWLHHTLHSDHEGRADP
jgi:3-isopropylmalate/(R)-2-methylmalate dehydratase small subunit